MSRSAVTISFSTNADLLFIEQAFHEPILHGVGVLLLTGVICIGQSCRGGKGERVEVGLKWCVVTVVMALG
jgi:hypothetical protein